MGGGAKAGGTDGVARLTPVSDSVLIVARLAARQTLIYEEKVVRRTGNAVEGARVEAG